MEQDFRWGGINIRCLFRYLLKNIWMGLALGIVFCLIGKVLSERSVSTSYSSKALVAVTRTHMAPFSENLERRMEYSNSASTVLSSKAFITQAEENSGIKDASVEATVVEGTNLLSITCTSGNPRSAYMFLKYLLDHFSEITEYVSGDMVFSIVRYPALPRGGITTSGSTPPAPILGAAGFVLVILALCIIYALPITYKGTHEVFKQYGNDIIQIVPYDDTDKEKKGLFKRKKKNKTNASALALAKLAFLLRQIIVKENSKVLLFTSAAVSEGKHTICQKIISELTSQGLNVFYMDGGIMDILSKSAISDDFIVFDEDLGCDTIRTDEEGMTFSRESVIGLVNDLRKTKDAVIICGISGEDTAASSIWTELSDKAYLIIRENTADIRKIDALYKNLKYTSGNLGGCILNAFS